MSPIDDNNLLWRRRQLCHDRIVAFLGRSDGTEMSPKQTAWKQPQNEESDGYGKAPGQLELWKPYGRYEPAYHPRISGVPRTADAKRVPVQLGQGPSYREDVDFGYAGMICGRDALHIAVATVHGMDYLLTWNCTHIANAITRPKIELICRVAGYEPPVICTPPESRKPAGTTQPES
jgi:hypothetical protein